MITIEEKLEAVKGYKNFKILWIVAANFSVGVSSFWLGKWIVAANFSVGVSSFWLGQDEK